jgi:hypothetical protein
MKTTEKIPYLIEDENVTAWRLRNDARHRLGLAAELAARAEALTNTVELPEEKRRSYESIVNHVLSSTMMDKHKQGELARRIHLTGECLWHACWVLFGAEGRGCDCHPCRKAVGR